MSKRFIFLISLFSVTLCSCYYKKLYYGSRAENVILKNKSDSLTVENSRKDTSILILRFKNDSVVKDNLALDQQTTEFRIKHIHLPTGGKFSTNAVKTSAKQYHSSDLKTLANVLYNPINLSFWGNDIYGDCVTAEEAFAKACNNPEIFIPENIAVGWASENGVLNGASLVDVLSKMTDVGFRSNAITYIDGNYSYVDFRNSAMLQNAIATGPIKIGLTSTQLEIAWRYIRRGWFALNFVPEQITNANQHCATLCGYGTLSWLAQQFNVQLPNGVNGQNLGYAIFTWGSIGIIDQQSLLAITHEAWIRNPTNLTNNSVSSFILKAMGGEVGSNVCLSHAFNNMDLRGTYPGGFGEMWICHDIGGGKIKLQARGAEAGNNYLSHAFGNISLHNTYDGGSGEEWIVHNLPNGQIALEAGGGERGKFLSHAFGNLDLRNNMEGGEAWLNIGLH
jgi:hypothetical protein